MHPAVKACDIIGRINLDSQCSAHVNQLKTNNNKPKIYERSRNLGVVIQRPLSGCARGRLLACVSHVCGWHELLRLTG